VLRASPGGTLKVFNGSCTRSSAEKKPFVSLITPVKYSHRRRSATATHLTMFDFPPTCFPWRRCGYMLVESAEHSRDRAKVMLILMQEQHCRENHRTKRNGSCWLMLGVVWQSVQHPSRVGWCLFVRYQWSPLRMRAHRFLLLQAYVESNPIIGCSPCM
jgi:hypothetical protein